MEKGKELNIFLTTIVPMLNGQLLPLHFLSPLTNNGKQNRTTSSTVSAKPEVKGDTIVFLALTTQGIC